MTFRLADPEKLYPFDVTIDVPSEDGFEPQTCRLMFRLLSTEEEADLITKGDLEYLKGVVGGWDESVCGHDGAPLEFGDETLEMLAGIPYFVVSVQREYRRFMLVLPGKTSRQPRATGGGGRRGGTKSRKRRKR